MSYHEYLCSQKLEAQRQPFYALLFALIRQADSDNTVLLLRAWPLHWRELYRRYKGPGGCLSWSEWVEVHGQELSPEQLREVEQEIRTKFQRVEMEAERNAQEYLEEGGRQ